MLSTVIAVLGTLLGAVVAGLLQHRAARTARDDARIDHRRDQELTAVTDFASAIASHRRAMTVREELRLTGADPDRLTEARAESHNTRSAIEAPKVLVAILAPSLAPAAQEAAQASYAIRNAADLETLTALREDAIKAADRFVAAAARRFA
ncbi:protein kilB (plasmid) [Streptoverticillium reticulum]|uniref:protein kilB n=1 Tax=Streptoverticillium reticulum TaxID=1433415 RepID=UPI0039BFB683